MPAIRTRARWAVGLAVATVAATLVPVLAANAADDPVEVVASTFEDGTTQGWAARGSETVAVSGAVAHTGDHSLVVTGRTQSWQGPVLNVLDTVEKGTRYDVSVWVRLPAGDTATQARVSAERRTAGTPSYDQIVGDTAVTADGWTNLRGRYTLATDVDFLSVYVETSAATVSFHIDDFTLSHTPLPPVQTDIPAVKDVLAEHFAIGAAIEQAQLLGNHGQLLARHFSTVTPGNDLKWSATQPAEGDFRFTAADQLVSWARANGVAVRGHTLVWHNQTPAWVFTDAEGNDLTATPEDKALLLARLDTHIRAVMGHYGQDIPVWDVVNEVIDETQPDGLRRSRWYEITGLDYIRTAFRVAREVAPEAQLVINDYNTNVPAKRDRLHDLIAQLRAEGVPVDAVGHQTHVNVDWPSTAETEAMLLKFAPLGIDQQITEMDVSIYTSGGESFPTPPADRLLKQAYRYRDLFEVYKRHSDKISSVTLWGLADDATWLDTFPVTRKDAPLLFDTRLQAKSAYWGVVDPSRIDDPATTTTSTTTTTTTTAVPAGCEVAYTAHQWPGGFQAEVRITNRGSADLATWTLAWSFPSGQRVTQLWNGRHTQNGAEVSVAHAGWNALLPVGRSVGFGFLASWTGANTAPTAFSLNGIGCAVK
ncbi:endo-1,4-beta-xylanase [Actinokineospora sp. 24-640]